MNKLKQKWSALLTWYSDVDNKKKVILAFLYILYSMLVVLLYHLLTRETIEVVAQTNNTPSPLVEMIKVVAPAIVILCGIFSVPVRLMIGKFKQMDKDLERLKDEVLSLKFESTALLKRIKELEEKI